MPIKFYYRPQCGLCREVEGPLLNDAAQVGAQVVFVNIDEDKAAWARYWDKIPVIEVDPQTILYEPIDRQALRSAIQKAHRQHKL